jgi:aldehyde:ferredoxin oxidoreductase
LVTSITGWRVSLFELMKVGERRLTMMRLFNARDGLDRKQDKLPKKFFKALQGTGPTAGFALDETEFEKVLDLYFQIVGWTPQGVPTPAKLVDLGIEWATDCLPE